MTPAASYKPLSAAILNGDEAEALSIIRQQSDAVSHWKPIMDAAYVGAPRIVKALLKAGADPNVISGTGHKHSPLIRCLHRQVSMPRTESHTQVLEVLLRAGADANLAAGQHLYPPVGEACIGGYEKDIKLLFDHGASRNLHLDAMLYDRAQLRRGLKKADPDSRDHAGRTPLHYLAFSGLWKNSPRQARASLDCANLLLDAGADADALDELVGVEDDFRATALWRACGWQKHEALAALLLEAGADPGNAIFAASFEGSGEMLDLLFQYRPSLEPRVSGRTPLIDLMYYKRPGNAAWLLEHGADVNAQDHEGMTPLHHAAIQGIRADVVSLLLDYGAKRASRDQSGKTALDYARDKKRTKLVPLLG